MERMDAAEPGTEHPSRAALDEAIVEFARNHTRQSLAAALAHWLIAYVETEGFKNLQITVEGHGVISVRRDVSEDN